MRQQGALGNASQECYSRKQCMGGAVGSKRALGSTDAKLPSKAPVRTLLREIQ